MVPINLILFNDVSLRVSLGLLRGKSHLSVLLVVLDHALVRLLYGVQGRVSGHCVFLVVDLFRHLISYGEETLSSHLGLAWLSYLTIGLHNQYVLVVKILSDLLIFRRNAILKVLTLSNFLPGLFDFFINSGWLVIGLSHRVLVNQVSAH